MQIIDGKKIAAGLLKKIQTKVSSLLIKPNLVVILVGENAASQVYIKNKCKRAAEAGIISSTIFLPNNISEVELVAKIQDLNNDQAVHGILVQLPLPRHIDQFAIINAIDPRKDVDCFHSVNVGNLAIGKNAFIPCTPYGCLHLIKHALGNNLSGLNALVVGRSNIVGKPMLHLLLQENCTVTIAHSRTKNLQEKCQQADIIVAAVGQPQLVKWVKKGATVIDVGINKVGDKLVGDVDFEAVKTEVRFITPVPGGVGPMTIIFLLINTVMAACQQNNIEISIEQMIS